MSRISFDPSFSDSPPRCFDRSTARITVMGSSQCGKTSLVLRWMTNTYQPVERGVYLEDIYHRTLLFHQFIQKHSERDSRWAEKDELKRHASVDVQVLDCESGDATYDNMEVRTAQIRQSDAFIVCFDPQSYEPFEDLLAYIHRIREILGDAIIVVCSTKSDLNTDSDLTLEDIDQQLQSCGLSVAEDFMEVSAKTGVNVNKLFCRVLSKISQHKKLARSSYASGHIGGGKLPSTSTVASTASSEISVTSPPSTQIVSPPIKIVQSRVERPRAVRPRPSKELEEKQETKGAGASCCIIC